MCHREIQSYCGRAIYYRHILQSLQEDIFVPGIFVLKSKSDGNLYTACVWPQHIPIILPQVDYVIVLEKYKKRFQTIELR